VQNIQHRHESFPSKIYKELTTQAMLRYHIQYMWHGDICSNTLYSSDLS